MTLLEVSMVIITIFLIVILSLVVYLLMRVHKLVKVAEHAVDEVKLKAHELEHVFQRLKSTEEWLKHLRNGIHHFRKRKEREE